MWQPQPETGRYNVSPSVACNVTTTENKTMRQQLNYNMQRQMRRRPQPTNQQTDLPTNQPTNHPSTWPWPRRVERWRRRKIEKHLIGNYELSACLSKKKKQETNKKKNTTCRLYTEKKKQF